MDQRDLEIFRHKLLVRRESLDALLEADALAITRIQASLERIAHGTFGDCVVCHGAIETERLRAIPEAERCSGCTH